MVKPVQHGADSLLITTKIGFESRLWYMEKVITIPTTRNIIKDVDFIREMCSTIRAARAEVGVPNIQPLMSATFYKEIGEFDWLMFSLYSDIVKQDCNLRYVGFEYVFDGDYEKFNINREASLNFREAGKVLGKETQTVAKALKSGDYTIVDGGVEVNGKFLDDNLVQVKVSVNNEENLKRDYHVTRVGEKSFIVLDTLIYSGLYMQRLAQEIIKLINKERRDRGFEVGDFVDVVLGVTDEYRSSLEPEFGYMDSVVKNAKCNVMYRRSEKLEVLSMKIQ
jgi:isoleucyl-tRNA synthetase